MKCIHAIEKEHIFKDPYILFCMISPMIGLVLIFNRYAWSFHNVLRTVAETMVGREAPIMTGQPLTKRRPVSPWSTGGGESWPWIPTKIKFENKNIFVSSPSRTCVWKWMARKKNPTGIVCLGLSCGCRAFSRCSHRSVLGPGLCVEPRKNPSRNSSESSVQCANFPSTQTVNRPFSWTQFRPSKGVSRIFFAFFDVRFGLNFFQYMRDGMYADHRRCRILFFWYQFSF